MKLIIILSVLSFGFYGCKKTDNCSGADVIRSVTSIHLKSYSDTSKFYQSTKYKSFGFSFTSSFVQISRDGTRNCRLQDLAVEYEDEFASKSISFRCNKTLYSKGIVYIKNSELMNLPIMKNELNNHPLYILKNDKFNIQGIDSIPKSEEYVFTLSVETTKGKLYTTDKSIFVIK